MVRTDEPLRDRELGILDRPTRLGAEKRFPKEAERRFWVGKLYYRRSGGESWAEVALRRRSVLAELNNLRDGPRVMLVCRDAVIMLFRYMLEGLAEQEVLELAAGTSILNASITRYVRPVPGHGSAKSCLAILLISWTLPGMRTPNPVPYKVL